MTHSRVKSLSAARQRSCVRGNGAGSTFTVAAFQDNHWLLTGCLSSGCHEGLPISNAFDVASYHPRLWIITHGFQHLRFIDIDLISKADYPGKANPRTSRPVDDDRAHSAGMGDETYAASLGHANYESCIQGSVCIDGADAVWSYDPQAIFARNLHHFLFPVPSNAAGLAKSPTDDNDMPNPTLATIVQHLANDLGWDDDYSQIHRIRDATHLWVAAMLQYFTS